MNLSPETITYSAIFVEWVQKSSFRFNKQTKLWWSPDGKKHLNTEELFTFFTSTL